MTKFFAALIASSFAFGSASSFAFGQPSVSWPSRNSKVICGGIADGEDLQIKVVVENELLKAESSNERILLYIDLHKAGQVRLAMVEALSDAELANLDAVLAKLSKEDAEALKLFRTSHTTDFYMGMTDGFVHLTTTFGKRTFTFSCREDAILPSATK